ncbi:protein TolR [Endomicrobiia bacterium]|nr:protein TolR [Endomicrobiia bacterium]GHT64173.1 protein TolR [Endomicrobiia bacterium]GHT69318.1 protein TolR [Endomicrobiia bacterium]GHT73375.1 protein TolR [Endomicrobiia bacterium]
MDSNKRRSPVKSDINIAPFTDVILVLLIIFMITTPALMQSGIKVNIPKTETTDSVNTSNIEVTISKEGNVYIEGKHVDSGNVENAIRKLIVANPAQAIVIKGDYAVQYDYVMRFMDQAKKSGATKFALAVKTK